MSTPDRSTGIDDRHEAVALRLLLAHAVALLRAVQRAAEEGELHKVLPDVVAFLVKLDRTGPTRGAVGVS